MNSKTKILNAIRNNKPSAVQLPEIPLFNQKDWNGIEVFQQMVELGGGSTTMCAKNKSLQDWTQQQFPNATNIASTVRGMQGNIDLSNIQHSIELETVDVAIIPSELAVAENGALWVTEQDCRHRVLPFITQHLVIVTNIANIVQNMHEAYQKISITETGFGVFIAGPSKTADIEQSLVIGAQGARSLHVIIKI